MTWCTGGGVGSEARDAIKQKRFMLWDQPGFLEAVLEVNLPAIGVYDLALEHVYYSFLGGIADRVNIGGGILVAHDWKHSM